jgi:hypothetical protein
LVKITPLLLRAAVEILAHAGHAQVLVHHHGVDVGVLVLEVHRLLDAGAAAVAGAVGQVGAGIVALAGALDEDHGLDVLAVGALDRAAVGLFCQFLRARPGPPRWAWPPPSSGSLAMS